MPRSIPAAEPSIRAASSRFQPIGPRNPARKHTSRPESPGKSPHALFQAHPAGNPACRKEEQPRHPGQAARERIRRRRTAPMPAPRPPRSPLAKKTAIRLFGRPGGGTGERLRALGAPSAISLGFPESGPAPSEAARSESAPTRRRPPEKPAAISRPRAAGRPRHRGDGDDAPMKTILVCGGRGYADRRKVCETLEA